MNLPRIKVNVSDVYPLGSKLKIKEEICEQRGLETQEFRVDKICVYLHLGTGELACLCYSDRDKPFCSLENKSFVLQEEIIKTSLDLHIPVFSSCIISQRGIIRKYDVLGKYVKVYLSKKPHFRMVVESVPEVLRFNMRGELILKPNEKLIGLI
jgi:hypothetical protein